jgi:(p)ppGpp synthase/HD superfamily hydrolase
MMQMETEEEMMTAVLHDVIEDSSVTLTDLAAEGLPTAVLAALALLTYDRKSASYEDYILAIKFNPLARRVKLADLAHNMDIRRLADLDRRALRRLQRYGRAWQLLND